MTLTSCFASSTAFARSASVDTFPTKPARLVSLEGDQYYCLDLDLVRELNLWAQRGKLAYPLVDSLRAETRVLKESLEVCRDNSRLETGTRARSKLLLSHKDSINREILILSLQKDRIILDNSIKISGLEQDLKSQRLKIRLHIVGEILLGGLGVWILARNL